MIQKKISGVLGLFVLCGNVGLLVAIEPGNQEIWPQWRGPTRDGQIAIEPGSESRRWPEKLSGDAVRAVWRSPLGPSYSGPIVSDTFVFTTETVNQKSEVVRALDRKTGRQVWEASWEGAMTVPFFAASNGSWIRSTPAFDGECLYVGGIRDVLVCLDAETGEKRWTTDFMSELKSELPSFGCVCSPLVDGEFIYIQAGAGCCKVDKRTGKIVWRSLKDGGGTWGSAFSSPVIATLAGQKQLLVQTRERLAGIDLENGAELWSQNIPAFRGMNILTPTVLGDSIFTSAYQGKSLMFQLASAGGKFAVTESWNNKATGYMSSPVILDGHIYLHLQNQRFTCIDLATGKTRWTTSPFGKYWSLVARGDRILALDEQGVLCLIRANPEKYEQLDSLKISENPSWAHLALCGDEIFIREQEAMAVYKWKMD